MTMLGVVLAGVSAPLLRAPTFYYWDDTAGASIGDWRAVGTALLHGHLPLLELGMWRGGNFAAESSLGLYNPLLLGLYAGTMRIDDLAVVAFVFKAFFFLTMALGAYLLCRQYGARPWMAAVAGAMLPLSGFTIWMDGASWVTGLTVSALTPWVWFTAKRAAEGRGSLLWVVLAGYLCGSAGNPYGLLSTAVVIGAVLVELAVRRRWRRLLGMVVAGVGVGLLCVPTYLPFVLSSSVSYRTGASLFNDEFLSPNLTDLAGLSSPSFTPAMSIFGESVASFPATYLAWFIVPLLPWFRWSALRSQRVRMVSVAVVGVVNLLLVLGPSQVWFFRWPLRLLPYVWLPVAVVVAVLLSAGLDRSRPRLRAGLSAAGILAGFWIAWSDVPGQTDRHVASTVLVAVLFAALLWAAARSRRLMALVALGGTLAVLLVQLAWMPVNSNVLDYNFPRSASQIQQRFADYRPGLTVQIASVDQATGADRSPDGVYRDMLFGSMYAVAGVESLTAYSGVGFNALDEVECIAYQGSSCPQAWPNLWQPPQGSQTVLADLLRAQRVVVQRKLIDTSHAEPPKGWRLARSTRYADVWERIAPLPWPDGRVSQVSGPVAVTADRTTGSVGETVRFEHAGTASTVTFARLAWPGYTATVDGRPVPVRQGPAGLLTVDLPEGVASGTLTLSWAPPGHRLSAAAAGLGLVAVVLLVGAEGIRRRRRGGLPDQSPLEVEVGS